MIKAWNLWQHLPTEAARQCRVARDGARQVRLGPGRDNNRIGCEAGQDFRRCIRLEVDLDTKLRDDRFQIGCHFAHGRVLRLDGCQIDKPAQPGPAFKQCHAMTPARGDLGGFQTRGPPTDDHDMLYRGCPAYKPLTMRPLTPGTRILDAADALFLADLMQTSVVARDADPHKVAATGQQLVRCFRVGYQLSRPPDEVGLTRPQHGFARLRRYAAEAYDRQLCCRLQRLVDTAKLACRDCCWRNLHPVA